MFDNFSVARLSHCVTSGPRKNYQTFTARHSGAARCRLIHGPAPWLKLHGTARAAPEAIEELRTLWGIRAFTVSRGPVNIQEAPSPAVHLGQHKIYETMCRDLTGLLSPGKKMTLLPQARRDRQLRLWIPSGWRSGSEMDDLRRYQSGHQ
ncbi:hypothetical protein NDU88_004014 [Pleurodeles waltl]|uniref:Uncharacterized protein n=1 Tax=Pleurodeles waltl TaxID=8319 RepID=A0AAV7W769_PLEWA|nr:hypothetical protein NDU88_004014 [Pleurodeles waltl]